eukprot:364950-Chlamydomonas_euryale.AAC.26
MPARRTPAMRRVPPVPPPAGEDHVGAAAHPKPRARRLAQPVDCVLALRAPPHARRCALLRRAT